MPLKLHNLLFMPHPYCCCNDASILVDLCREHHIKRKHLRINLGRCKRGCWREGGGGREGGREGEERGDGWKGEGGRGGRVGMGKDGGREGGTGGQSKTLALAPTKAELSRPSL